MSTTIPHSPLRRDPEPCRDAAGAETVPVPLSPGPASPPPAAPAPAPSRQGSRVVGAARGAKGRGLPLRSSVPADSVARLAAEQEVENLSGLSPNPEKDIFVVRENRTTCLMAEFAAKFIVPYDVWASNYVDVSGAEGAVRVGGGAGGRPRGHPSEPRSPLAADHGASRHPAVAGRRDEGQVRHQRVGAGDLVVGAGVHPQTLLLEGTGLSPQVREVRGRVAGP